MNKSDLDCPKCGTNMIKSYKDEAKFRMKLIVWNKDGMYAVCKGCNHEVRIDQDIMKSMETKFTFTVNKG